MLKENIKIQVASRQSPVTSRQSPVTSHQSPVASQQPFKLRKVFVQFIRVNVFVFLPYSLFFCSLFLIPLPSAVDWRLATGYWLLATGYSL